MPAKTQKQAPAKKPAKAQSQDEAYADTSKKAKKPDNGIKKPTNALFLYMNDRRAQFKKDFPNKGLGESSKMMSEEYKKLSNAKRQKYEKAAADDKARYQKEMSDAGLLKPAKTGPKKPMSAYMLFS